MHLPMVCTYISNTALDEQYVGGGLSLIVIKVPSRRNDLKLEANFRALVSPGSTPTSESRPQA